MPGLVHPKLRDFNDINTDHCITVHFYNSEMSTICY